MPKQYGMVIDLQKCAGYGADAFACKAENNTQAAGNGQIFNWANYINREEGTFQNVTYYYHAGSLQSFQQRTLRCCLPVKPKQCSRLMIVYAERISVL